MSLNPFPNGRCPTTNDLMVDRQLGQSYRTVKYVYDNWDVLKKNYDLLVLLPEAVWTFDPADYATAAQGLKADSAVQPTVMATAIATAIGALDSQLSVVAKSGQYSDLLGKPTLGTASAQDVGYFATAAQGAKADSAVQPGQLSTVATTGAYADLTGKPVLGTAAAQNVDAFATAAQGTKADAALPAAQKGAADGVAPLDAGAKIPAAYLPSYVDDVLEFASEAAFPAVGEQGKIYVALDTNEIFRWSGTAYIEISPSPGSTDAVPEGATNKYYTNARVLAAATPAAIGAATTAQGAKADTAVQPAALTAGLAGKANVPVAWATLVLQNSWTNFAEVAQYRLDGDVVEIRGLLALATAPAGVTFATLPAGFRPARLTFALVCGQPSSGAPETMFRISLDTNGALKVVSAQLAAQPTQVPYMIIDGARFPL